MKRTEPRGPGPASPEPLSEATLPLPESAPPEPGRPAAGRPEAGWADAADRRRLALPDTEVVAVVEARHGDPFAVLGMHKTAAGVVGARDAAGRAADVRHRKRHW